MAVAPPIAARGRERLLRITNSSRERFSASFRIVGGKLDSLESEVTSDVRDELTMKIKVFVPGDVAQIVIEYLHHMSSMFKCRGASWRWCLTVGNAVFFLN
jgi:hypothetical protein